MLLARCSEGKSLLKNVCRLMPCLLSSCSSRKVRALVLPFVALMPPSDHTEQSLNAAAPPLLVPELRKLPRSKMACSRTAKSLELTASWQTFSRVWSASLVCTGSPLRC